MSLVESSVLWSDQVNDSYASTSGMAMIDDVAAKNESKDHLEAAYAIKWGEKVEVSSLAFLLALAYWLTHDSPDYGRPRRPNLSSRFGKSCL
jgi:hypothetical protein